jgi:uncharacterized protein
MEDSATHPKAHGLLKAPLPLLNDPEGDYIPDSAAFVVDAHVHLFPDYLFAPIRQWFENFGWPIRYQLSSEEIIKFLLSHGIDHLVALHYAHKPGIARELNAYMANICRFHPQVTAMATVYPGEEGAGAILEQAFEDGLKGVKLHSHVIFGTDFPNLPYAWDREIKRLVQLNLAEEALAGILGRNALEFYNI